MVDQGKTQMYLAATCTVSMYVQYLSVSWSTLTPHNHHNNLEEL